MLCSGRKGGETIIARKDLTIVVLASLCITSTLFMTVPIGSSPSGEYDPRLDVTGSIEGVPDGVINMRDIALVCSLFLTNGTPTNWTQLFEDVNSLKAKVVELETRLDALNATVMSLSENTQQVYADLFDESTDGAGQLRIDYPASMFTKPPKLSMTAWFSSGGYAQMAYVTIVENTKDNCTIYLQDADGMPLSNHVVQISYVAVENKTDPTMGMKHCAGTEQKITIGNQITIAFPNGMFIEPPQLSVTAFVLTGPDAGKTCYISSMSVYAENATLGLQTWDGAVWIDVGDGRDVQVSYTAVE